MEETSIYLRELFKQGTPDDLNLRFSMDIALSELLRPIDRLLYRYNSMIYEEVTAFLNEKGFTENDFRGFLGGDETIIGLPINYWKVNSVDDALENIASLVSRIEARLDSDEFTMYGQRVGIRVGISNCKHHYYGHHIGDGFFVEDYSYALKNADTAANLSKKEGDTHPVFVGELGSNPREGNIRISQATPFRHNDYANTEASSEVARYNLIKYNLERGEIEEASIYFRNNIHAPFSAHAGNIVARVVLAGTGNFNTRNDGGAYLGAKDANNIFGFQATNEWIYDIRRFTNERLGCEIEGRSGRLTYLV